MSEIKVNTDQYSKKTYLQWYELMLLLRRFEEKAGQLYGQQKIRGFCHLYIGQEAVAAGIISATRPSDPIITAYRDHGMAIAKGISPEAWYGGTIRKSHRLHQRQRRFDALFLKRA